MGNRSPVGRSLDNFDQPKTPDIKTRLPDLAPIIVDSVQSIVPITSLGRVRRVLACTPHDPHWQVVPFVTGQGQIAACQRLVGYLAPGLRVSAPMARIENFVTKILCILITSG